MKAKTNKKDKKTTLAINKPRHNRTHNTIYIFVERDNESQVNENLKSEIMRRLRMRLNLWCGRVVVERLMLKLLMLLSHKRERGHRRLRRLYIWYKTFHQNVPEYFFLHFLSFFLCVETVARYDVRLYIILHYI